MLRLIDGRLYTEEMLADPKVLSGFGFNQREIDFLAREPWWKLPALYFAPYVERSGRVRPFEAGLELRPDDARRPVEEGRRLPGRHPVLRRLTRLGASLVWHAGLLKRRGVPLFPPEVFRMKGGNQTMPDTFTRLGERVRLGCPVTGIERGDSRSEGALPRGRPGQDDGGRLAGLRHVPGEAARGDGHTGMAGGAAIRRPELPVLHGLPAGLPVAHPLLGEGQVSPNIVLGEPSLEHVWRMADDVDTPRGLIVGTAVGLDPRRERARHLPSVLPGKRRTSSRPSSSTGHAIPGPWPASP